MVVVVIFLGLRRVVCEIVCGGRVVLVWYHVVRSEFLVGWSASCLRELVWPRVTVYMRSSYVVDGVRLSPCPPTSCLDTPNFRCSETMCSESGSKFFVFLG